MSRGMEVRAVRRLLEVPSEFLSEADCRALLKRIEGLAKSNQLTLSVDSRWTGSAKWARNRMQTASDQHVVSLTVGQNILGAGGGAETTRLDDEGLLEALQAAQLSIRFGQEPPENLFRPFVARPMAHPTLWSDATYKFDAQTRVAVVNEMIAGAEAAGFQAAGELAVLAHGEASLSSQGLARYYPITGVECSMTVRDLKTSASGWAGIDHYDIHKIDPKQIAAIAIDKCRRSANPSAIEPGRFTVILEPQAVADFMVPLVSMLDRPRAEAGPQNSPFATSTNGQSKIGQRVIDERLTLSADPMDPDAGFVPFQRFTGDVYRATAWIDRGVLRELAYNEIYALKNLGEDQPLLNSRAFRLAPVPGVVTSTIPEMIEHTQRGLLVTRFSDVFAIEQGSLVCTGYTRDGLWLIENGKISRPVKNLRLSESPMFMLNNLEAIGTPQRVFMPYTPAIVPPLKARDFNFTALADAV